jgi:hypothetical protein
MMVAECSRDGDSLTSPGLPPLGSHDSLLLAIIHRHPESIAQHDSRADLHWNRIASVPLITETAMQRDHGSWIRLLQPHAPAPLRAITVGWLTQQSGRNAGPSGRRHGRLERPGWIDRRGQRALWPTPLAVPTRGPLLRARDDRCSQLLVGSVGVLAGIHPEGSVRCPPSSARTLAAPSPGFGITAVPRGAFMRLPIEFLHGGAVPGESREIRP